MRVVWTSPARKHRDALVRYIALDNPEAAIMVDRAISAAISRLILFPSSGRIGRVADTREVVILPNYILVYMLRDDSIVILHVLHASQQYPPQ